MKGAVLAAIAAAGLVVQAGAADTAAFYGQAVQLEQSWRSAEGAGVPASALQPARADLQSLRERWSGPLPYATVSGAALGDPFSRPREMASRGHGEAVTAARARAEAALLHLREVSGPNDTRYYDRLVSLGQAHEPVDYERLRRRWDGEAAAMAALRDQLAAGSGGLAGGLPKDVVDGEARLVSLADAAAQAGISTDPAWQTSVDVQLYLARDYPAMLSGHGVIAEELGSALGILEKRVNARKAAETALARIPKLLPQALQYGIGDEYRTRADELQQSFKEARSDDDLVKVADGAQALLKDLDAANQGRLPLQGIGCLPNAPAKEIVLHLKTQQLIAYENGCPVLRTPITTGRPALPTGRGTFQIFYKSRSYKMISPWPKESPFWYPDAWVSYAMEFIGDGTFFHTADWQPDATYGPGSQYGPYASHGCVHVLDGIAPQLYDWAPIGTTVVVGD
jgi:hypothetical protein